MALPSCPYRGPEKNGRFACAAAEGQPVAPAVCASCAIPEALAHKRASLYLLPLRDRGKARFACRAVSCEENVFAVNNWQHLCFCRYWFPRPPQEAMVPGLDRARSGFLRSLRDGPRSLRPYPADPNCESQRTWSYGVLARLRDFFRTYIT